MGITTFEKTVAPNPYAGAVVELEAAQAENPNAAYELTVELKRNKKGERLNKELNAFQRAANDKGHTAKVRAVTEDEDNLTVTYLIQLTPKQKPRRSAKVDDVATESE